ncbi:E3 SUMO-protein ligase SIZ1 [Phoenix dactylifera]|uniref:E3 SUMO-protein ligase SIZ1 n=1 Tax=Phoenix dactylifera TaxID=42345 RepID=A0A8B7C0B2_PHODC|nr:E3 SUMO-protein ligase SIZ1 [Phoenix dactylifera]
MDLVPSCRDKLAYFRIKELKDVLTQLGLAKQGKKQDLVDRILALLSDEQVSRSQCWGKKNSIGKDRVAKIIDDTYRKMQVHGATDLASKSHSGSDFNHMKPKEEMDDSYQLDMNVRCLCGSSLITESMIKCEDLRCQVWQHIGCVIIPEKPMEGVSPELPPHFYCEQCRINRADPFWVTIRHPLPPVKLTSSGITAEGTNTMQNVERTFQLSRADREMLQKTEYDLQVWCILLNDKVPFRMQWPQHADLQVNGAMMRVVGRPGSQLLGISGRDDGPVITTYSREGINKICLSRCDTRIFCFGIRIAKRRTVQQVLNLVPKEADGEHFEDALARVCRCIGGGANTENADSDSDLEVVADSVTVNLRCPMSGSRIKIAGRFKPCVHMGCFDLETFVELNQRSRKWQCPICLKNYSLENIIIDPYFNRITSRLQTCGEDVNEIDVKPDGCWRTKIEGEFRELAQWHMPDGTLCATTDSEIKPNVENLRQVKQDSKSEGHAGLRLGIKRNRNGTWEISKSEDMKPPSSGSHVLGKLENHCQNIIPMSSSPTGSYRDGEDPSVNQEGGGPFDLSLNNGHELDSLSLNFDPTYNIEDRIPPAPLKDQDIIVLSDSDEDNLTTISPENAFDTGPAGGSTIPFTANHLGVSERYPEDLGLGTSGTSCLGIFNNNGDDFGMPLWPMQTGPHTGPGFQLFGTDADIPDALVDSHNSLGCTTMNGYGLTSDGGLEDASGVQDFSNCRSNTDMNGSLVDNPRAFGNDDPSLQIFLPSGPAGVTMQADLHDHTEMPNGIHSDDWISLTLAAGGGHGESTSANGLNPGQQLAPKESRTEPLEDAASLLLSMNDDRANKANSNTQRSDNSFSHPPRSVRPRLYLSIDTDSD